MLHGYQILLDGLVQPPWPDLKHVGMMEVAHAHIIGDCTSQIRFLDPEFCVGLDVQLHPYSTRRVLLEDFVQDLVEDAVQKSSLEQDIAGLKQSYLPDGTRLGRRTSSGHPKTSEKMHGIYSASDISHSLPYQGLRDD